jgi:hypothetical protein
MFLIVQHLRTVAAETDTNEIIDRLIKSIYRAEIDQNQLAEVRIKLTDAAAFNVATALRLSPICYDLKPAVLITGRKDQFITSDNPVALVNSFWKGRFPGPGNNLAAAGLLIFLPLSPRHTLLLYDQNVYSIAKSANNSVFIRKSNDILNINELQILRGYHNLYFTHRDQLRCIEEQFPQHKDRRRRSYVAVHEFVPGERPGSYVRPDSDDEVARAGRSLVLGERLGIDATLRLSFVQLRPKPRYFYDGSAAGALRDPAWVKVLDDFSKGAKGEAWHFGDLEAFARLHPLWQDVRPWKKRVFGR